VPGSVMAHRYWCPNGIGIAVVAVRGAIGDWAAYIGAEPTGWREQDAVEVAAANGDKLGEDLARAIFPYIEGEYRR